MSDAHRTSEQCYENTDREIWRREGPDPPGNYYQPSIHVTASGAIGINCGGLVYVQSVEDWHALAKFFDRYQHLQRVLFEFKEALEGSNR